MSSNSVLVPCSNPFFFQIPGIVNDKDSKDSITEGENLEEDEEEEEGGAETEEQSGNESEVNEPEEEVNLIYLASYRKEE